MNPFKPTAGKVPPVLIGRGDILKSFACAIDDGPGAPGRLMLIGGQRGYGKTVMLTELGKLALSRGWTVVSETATEGFVNRLIDQLDANTRLKSFSISPSISIAGVASAQLGSVNLDRGITALTMRTAIKARLKKLKPEQGILITVDEAQAANMQELATLSTTYQQVLADMDLDNEPGLRKRGIALVMAALPSLTDEVLQEKVMTFLRRSTQYRLGEISIPEVALAYVSTVERSGKKISIDCAEQAAKISEGNPYKVQLIGYYMWQSAELAGRKTIGMSDVEAAGHVAVKAFCDAVCAPAYNALTQAQREFLAAMVSCEASKSDVYNTKEIEKASGKSASWISKYRKSLIDSQIIKPAGHGKVEFYSKELQEYILARN